MNETPTTDRILLVSARERTADDSAWRKACREARELGFDAVLVPPLWKQRDEAGAPLDPDSFGHEGAGRETMVHALARLAGLSAAEGVRFYMDVILDEVAEDGVQARSHPGCYARPQATLDPRARLMRGLLRARLDDDGRIGRALLEDWAARLSQWLDAGVSGFRCKGVAGLGASDWRQLIGELRETAGGGRFMAWTPGMTAEQVQALRGTGFDATFLSLPWWDYRSGWLADEYQRLATVAPVIAPVTDEGPACLGGDAGLGGPWRRCLGMAAVSGSGVLVSDRIVQAGGDSELRAMNEWLAARRESGEPLTILTGPLSPCTAAFRGGAGVVLNPSSDREAPLDWPLLRARLPDSYGDIQLPSDAAGGSLGPAACQRFSARRAAPVCAAAPSTAEKRRLGLGLMSAPRIAIERIEPAVDEGRFAVKATLGQPVSVEADIFMDGHELLAACAAWRAADEAGWQEAPMQFLGNDRWRAEFTPTRVGRHVFTVRAWHDAWSSYRAGVLKKREAGVDISLDLREGQALLREALHRARRDAPEAAEVLARVLESDGADEPADASGANEANEANESDKGDALLSETTARAMARVDARPFETSAEIVYPLMVERREAGFSSWYELFPRSQGQAPGLHGTFADVRRRLPAIRDMGFDVLYFPPIHPIGRTNRKGRNNALAAAPDDPGSPYAIGSEEGGHDAVHPQLGTLEEFGKLLRDAREHGLEVALDFAIQCSPDHPWLKEHRNWFDWRPDGSLRYAENPPKRYEDIVNPDFYHGSQPKARASLWRALRDVVLYWIDQGVRIFRVDNPHTKPLPFWEWMLGEIHARHPDVIFLSEAFTRPKMMYRLAKLGFSQSYTYFTWRNDKRELTEYLEELAAPPVADFFRPNFFVNTPDINPHFLQASGRAGFLIRAALAATLSGSWGMYSGFELCEARALPGREEYLDSEKYELRWWDWDRPGNIIAEIAQLNRIRKGNPALWSHRGVRFHTVHDDQVLFFSKSTAEGDNIVLVVISLDPHAVRRAWLELPLGSWGLKDDAGLQLEDAGAEAAFELRGRHHEVELSPQRPYLIWRARRLG